MSDQLAGVRVCSVTDVLSLVGDRYSLQVVREINYGCTRFTELLDVGGVGARATTTLLRAWTDRGDPPVPCRLSIEGLAALAEVTRAIEGC